MAHPHTSATWYYCEPGTNNRRGPVSQATLRREFLLNGLSESTPVYCSTHTGGKWYYALQVPTTRFFIEKKKQIEAEVENLHPLFCKSFKMKFWWCVFWMVSLFFWQSGLQFVAIVWCGFSWLWQCFSNINKQLAHENKLIEHVLDSSFGLLDHDQLRFIKPATSGFEVEFAEIKDHFYVKATRVAHSKCLVCGCSLADAPIVTCARCDTLCHQDCWQYNGRCSVFGCNHAQCRPIQMA